MEIAASKTSATDFGSYKTPLKYRKTVSFTHNLQSGIAGHIQRKYRCMMLKHWQLSTTAQHLLLRNLKRKYTSESGSCRPEVEPLQLHAVALSAWISRFVNLKNTGFSTGLERNPSKNSTFATQVSSALLLGTWTLWVFLIIKKEGWFIAHLWSTFYVCPRHSYIENLS